MGQPLTENDFYAIILGSLPPSFDPYISTMNTTSSVLGTTLLANDLMLKSTCTIQALLVICQDFAIGSQTTLKSSWYLSQLLMSEHLRPMQKETCMSTYLMANSQHLMSF